MSHYKVTIEGSECIVKLEGLDTKVGFFTTRYVKAANALEAETKASEMVIHELKAMLVAGSPIPDLSVVEITRVSFFGAVFKSQGFTFYPSEESDDVLP
jgi:hypothetical protein